MGNAKKRDENGLTKRNKRYIKARMAGKPLQECKAIAGYAPSIPTSKIEKPGSAVFEAIQRELLVQGMTDEFMAREIKYGLERSKTAVTRFNPRTGETVQDPDLGAHERYIKNLAKLKGYEREKTPAVAVQINNTNNGLPGAENLTDGETEKLIDALRAEIVARESADVFEASIADEDSEPHTGVVQPDPGTPEETPGGGQP